MKFYADWGRRIAVVPPRETVPMVAKLFAEFALEKWEAGDRETAIRAIAAACRINPSDEKLREWRDEIETNAHP